MIALSPQPSAAAVPRLTVIGLGSAGGNILDRLVLDGLVGAELIAVNTDTQALSGSVAPRKVQLGRLRTRGLGAGGDPEVGAEAVEEALSEIDAAIDGAEMVILLAGLGGGTGSGALAPVAHTARERGARVAIIATLPFGFEGKRRREQALESLAAAEELADLVICFENDRMGDLASARAGIQEAFSVVDQTLAEAVRSFAALVRGRGLLHLGLDELAATFGSPGTRALFGWAEATGDNRAHQAAEAALRAPLLEKGRHLREANAIIVHLAGSADLTLQEAQIALEEVRRQTPESIPLFCGLAVDPEAAPHLRVTILAATTVAVEASAPPALPAPAQRRPTLPARPGHRPPAPSPVHHEPLELSVELPAEPVLPQHVPSVEPESEFESEPEFAEAEFELAEVELDTEPEPEPEPAPIAPPPPRPRMRPLFAPMQSAPREACEPTEEELTSAAKAREERQEQMQFEPVHRGRFEKSEPTIVDGQNLDIPTFMRRKPQQD